MWALWGFYKRTAVLTEPLSRNAIRHQRCARIYHTQLFSCCIRQIQRSSGNIRSPILNGESNGPMIPEVGDTEFRAERIFAMRHEHGFWVIPLAAGKPMTEKSVPRCANNFLLGMNERGLFRVSAQRCADAFVQYTERSHEKDRDQKTIFKQG